MDSNTELAAELKAAIDYTAEQCANALYVPVKAETAQAILTALTQPAEQIADGAVGVTQRDREAWIAYEDRTAISLSPAFVAEIRAGKHDDDRRLKIFTTHAQQARAQALEEAAKVAEDRHEHWQETEPDGVVCDVTACRDIATAIRALNGQGGGV